VTKKRGWFKGKTLKKRKEAARRCPHWQKDGKRSQSAAQKEGEKKKERERKKGRRRARDSGRSDGRKRGGQFREKGTLKKMVGGKPVGDSVEGLRGGWGVDLLSRVGEGVGQF